MREPDEKGVMDATELLRAWSEGDETALNELVPLVERELHRLARAYMRRERKGHRGDEHALADLCVRQAVGDSRGDRTRRRRPGRLMSASSAEAAPEVSNPC